MIDWDDDIDLAIPPQSYNKIIKIIEKCEKDEKGFYILPNIDIKIELIKWDENALNNKKYDPIIKTWFLNDSDNELNFIPFIDLIIYLKKNDNYIANANVWSNFIYPIKDIYPLKKVKFENIKCYSVKNHNNYLNKGYIFWRHLALCHAAHHSFLENNLTRKEEKYYILK
jgi:phosphorylcholine metabolism protein LicD